MDEPSPISEPRPDQGVDDRSRPPPAPRWIKVFGVVVAALVLVVLVLLLTGNNHGPGLHLDRGKDPSVSVNHRVPHP